MLKVADERGIETMFHRAETGSICPTGAEGGCCKVCYMGPCRFIGKDKNEKRGVCGASLGTVVARNYLRECAGGASAHADHGRDIAHTLLLIGRGEAADYKIKDPVKLRKVAGYFSIDIEGKDDQQLALEVATAALNDWGRQEGYQTYSYRAPKKRQELWDKLGVRPRGFDREVVDSMHRTHGGGDQDADHLMQQAIRMCLASGWGGSMLATDLSDIIWGTPRPLTSESNLGILKDDEVNIIIHGHEPTLSELIVDAAQDPEMIEYAKSKGANGITLGGICCTANEVWMRRGVPPAGNSLHQELAILTGAVELMVVDIQCVFEGLATGGGAVPHPPGDHQQEGADHRRDPHRVRRGARARDRQADRQDGGSTTTRTAGPRTSTSPTSRARSSPASRTSTSATCWVAPSARASCR